MEILQIFFKKIDKFGYSQQLRIYGESSYKTAVGGFLTLSVFFLYGIAIIYFGQEFWKMNHPIVVSSSREYDIMPDIIIGKNDFSIFFTIETKYYVSYIDDSIYSVYAQMFEYENGKLIATNPVEVGPCSLYYKSSSEISNKTLIDPSKYYCVKPDEYKLTGFWGDKKVSQAHIFIDRCVNSTKNLDKPCKSNEEIDEILSGGVIGFYATNFVKKINDVENPVSAFLHDNFHILDLVKPITCILNLRQLTFSTDLGFLLEDISTVVKPYFDSAFWQNGSKQGNLFAHIHLIGFPLGETILRKYSKIQDITMKIGGLGSFMQFIALMIGTCYSKLQYRVDLLFNVLHRHSGVNDKKPKIENQPEFINLNYIKNNNYDLLCCSMNLLNQQRPLENNPSSNNIKEKASLCLLNDNLNLNKSSFNESLKNKIVEEKKINCVNKFEDNKFQAAEIKINENKILNFSMPSNIQDKKIDEKLEVEKPSKDEFNINISKYQSAPLSRTKIDSPLRKSIVETNLYYSICNTIKDIFCYVCITTKYNKLYKKRIKNVFDKYNHSLSVDTILEKTLLIEAISKILFKDKGFQLEQWLEKTMLNNLLDISTKKFSNREVFLSDINSLTKPI